MITIIAGKYKGQKLTGSNSKFVRPTLARVKKSMLQILEPFTGKKVLDLCAGVGNLGIEAVSRGAGEVIFVEKDNSAFQILKKNLNSICKSDHTEVYKMDIRQFFKKNTHTYDIIIADPPYGMFEFTYLRDSIRNILTEGGIFCMEMKKAKIDAADIRIKTYGKSQVVFWEGYY